MTCIFGLASNIILVYKLMLYKKKDFLEQRDTFFKLFIFEFSTEPIYVKAPWFPLAKGSWIRKCDIDFLFFKMISFILVLTDKRKFPILSRTEFS